jgi:hypothetical protein
VCALPLRSWPFAKLPNGFGSHRYVYSPILFDSQVANSDSFSTRSSNSGYRCYLSYYSTTDRETWAMEMRTTSYHFNFLGCWCSFRLLLCLETLLFPPMEIHTACQSAASAAGDAGSYYTYAGFLAMGNGNGDDGNAILLPGELHQFLVLLLWGFGLRQWAMEKDLFHLLPGTLVVHHVYCPIMGRKVGNGANGESHGSRKDIQ